MISKILILSIKFFQIFISPLLRPSCRFLPSCSDYGIQAIHKFGPAKGSYLTLRRILKCHPLGESGIDEVP